MDDDVVYELDGYPSIVGDADVGPMIVDDLLVVDHQLLGELDDHVANKDDPEGLVLDDPLLEHAILRFHQVVIRRIGHRVEVIILAIGGIAIKAFPACG